MTPMIARASLQMSLKVDILFSSSIAQNATRTQGHTSLPVTPSWRPVA